MCVKARFPFLFGNRGIAGSRTRRLRARHACEMSQKGNVL